MEIRKTISSIHDEVIKWKHFPRYWSFVRGIHRSPVNSPHKGQWRGTLMFSLVCTWTNGWVNTCRAGDLRRHCTHYVVTVMLQRLPPEITYQYYNQDGACLVEPGRVPTLAIRRESRARVASSYLEWKKKVLTHWCRDKMVAISQTTFSSAFSWMKMYEFRLGFHWSLFLTWWP